VNAITPDEFRALDIAWAIRTGMFGGIFAALLALPFVDGGRLLWLLIGG
jgi:hypothetical protein